MDIERAYIEGYTVQNFIKGFLDRLALRLGSITHDQLYFLHLYFVVVQGGITSKIVNEYEKAYPKKTHPQYYEGLESKFYRILIDNAYDVYSCYKDEFRKEQFLNIFQENKASRELFTQFQNITQSLTKSYEPT